MTTFVPLSRLDTGRNWSRASNFLGDIEALAVQIESSRQLTPLWVRKNGRRFEIIAGERRYRALCILEKRGGWDVQKIPVEIIEADDREAFLLNVTENAGRLELNRFDLFMTCRVAIQELKLSPEVVAKRLGCTANHVYRCARIATLVHPEILQGIRNGAPVPFDTLRRWLTMSQDAQLEEYNGKKHNGVFARNNMRSAVEIRIALQELGNDPLERYAAEWLAWVLRDADHKPRSAKR